MNTRTLVFFMRHQEHGTGEPWNALRHGNEVPWNVLTERGRMAAIKTGKKLRTKEAEISRVISSPQGRTIETALCVMQGLGRIVPFTAVDKRIGNFSLGRTPFDHDDLIVLSQHADENELTLEQQALNDLDFEDRLKDRGAEGVEAILEYVKRYPGEQLLICSHAGSRIEPVIANFEETELYAVDSFVYGQMALLIFGNDGQFLKREDLEVH